MPYLYTFILTCATLFYSNKVFIININITKNNSINNNKKRKKKLKNDNKKKPELENNNNKKKKSWELIIKGVKKS